VVFPVALRLVVFPVALRLVVFPVALRLVVFPVALRLVVVPVIQRLVMFLALAVVWVAQLLKVLLMVVAMFQLLWLVRVSVRVQVVSIVAISSTGVEAD
jgi:hypothetical protein